MGVDVGLYRHSSLLSAYWYVLTWRYKRIGLTTRVYGICLHVAIKIDAEEVCGGQQLCAGAGAGIEGAVQAMNELFEENRHNG